MGVVLLQFLALVAGLAVIGLCFLALEDEPKGSIKGWHKRRERWDR